MRLLRSGLYLRFIAAMGALALVPLAFMSYQLIGINQEGVQAAVLELQTKLAEKISEKVGLHLRTYDERLAFALGSLQRNMEWSDKVELLRSLVESHSGLEEIALLNPKGGELYKVYSPDFADRAPELSSHEDRPLFRKFKESGAKTTGVEVVSGVPKLRFYAPVTPAASLYASLSLQSLAGEIAAERVGGTGFAVLVGPGGDLLAYPSERLSAEQVSRFKEQPVVRQALGAVSVGSTEYRDLQGVEQISAYAPVPGLSGAVVIQQPRAEAYLAASRMKRIAVSIAVVFGVLALAVALWTARRLSAPLLMLTRTARQVAEGDFGQRVDIRTADELQELGDTFNYMVSELKRYAEIQVDKLVAEQRKTQAILFSIADGILLTDYEGRIQLANRRARDLLGAGPEEAIEGRPLQDLLPEGNLRKLLVQVASNPKKDVFKEIDLSDENYRRIFRVSALPVVTPRGGSGWSVGDAAERLGVVTALHDVTFEKELDKMKESFLHSITHDLRNPMGAILGFAEFLVKGVGGELAPQQVKMVDSIYKSANRLLAMINNILDVAKMEEGRLSLDLKEVSVHDVASRAAELLEVLAKKKAIRLSVDGEGRPALMADENLLERVFTNLIGNAIKFTPDEGSITVHLEDQGNQVYASVEDSGEGIPDTYRDRIFEKFEQVPGQKRGGTGLGLTICKHVVESHLGRIWVESETGKGSKFCFTLPKGLAKDDKGGVVLH